MMTEPQDPKSSDVVFQGISRTLAATRPKVPNQGVPAPHLLHRETRFSEDAITLTFTSDALREIQTALQLLNGGFARNGVSATEIRQSGLTPESIEHRLRQLRRALHS